MDYKTQLTKRIASLLLLIALMMPTAVKLIHIFDEHEHVACTVNKTHLHESISKCEICTFQLVSFNYDVIGYPNLLVSEAPIHVETALPFISLYSYKVKNSTLRAPPHFA